MLKQTTCKNTLILVGADKGGVGKTTLTRLILDFMGQYPSSCRIFDTEPGIGVLKRFYPPAETVNLTDPLDLAKVIDGLDKARVTVVDIRAGLLTPTLNSFHRIGLKHGTETHVAVFHVLGNTVASLAEVKSMAALLAGQGDHIVVKNHATPDTRFVPVEATAEAIEIGFLDTAAADRVDQRSQTFTNFIKDATNSRTLRGLTDAWFADGAEELHRIGVNNIVT
jgi:hypothetical protein